MLNAQKFLEYIQKNNKTHIIFDFDFTLCKLDINWDNWPEDMTNLFKSYDSSFSPKNTGEIADAQNVFIKRFGQEMREKVTEVNFVTESTFKGYTKIALMLETFEIACEHARVSIWTSNDRRTIQPIVNELEMTNKVHTLVTRSDVTYVKPNPEGFFMINKDSKPKEEFVMIGDSLYADKGAADAAGIDFLHVDEFVD